MTDLSQPTLPATAVAAASPASPASPARPASPASPAQPRVVRAPRGAAITCRSWLTEAAYRMLQNNLDPEVAENPEALVVYGGIGKAELRLWTLLV